MSPSGGSPQLALHRTDHLIGYQEASESAWTAPHVAQHATLVDLVELFFEIVYPIFPLFHQPSFVRRISRAEYTCDRSLFAVTMAVCALVSARVRDGAVFNPRWDVEGLQEPRPHAYYIEATRQASQIPTKSDLNTLRTHAILALAAIQEGKTRDMHEHLGRYHTVLAMEGLHDEDNWPAGLGLVETEERRRLFWSIYTLDVFTSIAWGGVIRSREHQFNVAYPIEVDDDMFDDAGLTNTALPLDSPSALHVSTPAGAFHVSWLAGRNFQTDLFRVLEHVVMQLPAQKPRAQRHLFMDEGLSHGARFSQESVLASVMQLYADLPPCLKEINAVASKPRLDRFGFQAADNLATVQLLRMVLLSATGSSITERCRVVNEVVTAFVSIPTAYHHAISVPLLFHLSVIGQILGATLGQPLCESDYRGIRDAMLSLVQLLSTLECLHASKGASQRLKDQITLIDDYMLSMGQNARNPRMAIRQTTGEAQHESLSEALYSATDVTAPDETLDLSQLQLPSDLLGDFSQIFDFAGLSQS